MKNEGLDGVVICDPVIAARADGLATRPPTTSAPANAVATTNLIRATREQEGRGPIGAPSTSASCFLGAAGVRAAVAARVAAAGADHPPTAAGAFDRVLPAVEEGRLAGRRRLARLGRRRLGAAAARVALGEPRLHLGGEDPGLLLLLGGEERLAE